MAKFYALLLAILIPFSAAAQNPRSAKGFSERGLDRYSAGDYAGAIADFTMEIRLTSVLGIDKKALIRSYAEGEPQSTSIPDEVTAIDPRTAGAYVNRGNAFFAMNRILDATDDYNRAIAIRPGMKEAYICRGSAYLILQKFREAEADYTKALRLDPKYVKALVGRGMVRFDKGERSLAFEDLDRAVALEPRNPEAWQTRGEAKRMSGDAKGALIDLERALSIDPNNAMAHLVRGTVRLNHRDLCALRAISEILAQSE